MEVEFHGRKFKKFMKWIESYPIVVNTGKENFPGARAALSSSGEETFVSVLQTPGVARAN